MKRPLQQNVENSELLQIVFNVNGGLKTRNVHRPKGELYNWPPPTHTHPKLINKYHMCVKTTTPSARKLRLEAPNEH